MNGALPRERGSHNKGYWHHHKKIPRDNSVAKGAVCFPQVLLLGLQPRFGGDCLEFDWFVPKTGPHSYYSRCVANDAVRFPQSNKLGMVRLKRGIRI